jgi:hypothetical protein
MLEARCRHCCADADVHDIDGGQRKTRGEFVLGAEQNLHL